MKDKKELNSPSSQYDIDKFIEQLYQNKYLKFNEIKYVIEKSKEIFSKENNIEEISNPVTICGDIHGQFYDLLELFRLGGKLPHTNYIFLGNYINKGYYSIETLSLLLCLKLRYPKRIYLIRGNQETEEYSRIYDFYDECIRKYGDDRLWKYFNDLFNYLPLCVLIYKKILCIHRGLSRYIKTLDDIKKINRAKKLSFGDDDPRCDLLWNEPQDNDGFSFFPKGRGELFGKNITEEFCKINGLGMIIRGQNYIKNGYSLTHGDKLISICSSPNYCYRFGNEGAIMEIDENMNYNFYTFDSAPRRGKIELMQKTLD